MSQALTRNHCGVPTNAASYGLVRLGLINWENLPNFALKKGFVSPIRKVANNQPTTFSEKTDVCNALMHRNELDPVEGDE